jgi:PrtD family type I secretion system ABC transporter
MQAKTARRADEITDVLKGSRGSLLSAGFFSGVVNVLMLTGPLFMLQVYDRVLSSGSVPTLVALAVITMVLYAYYGFLEYVRSRIMVRIGRRIEESLRGRVFDTVATLAMRKGSNAGGQPIADLSTIRQYLGGQGPIAFLDMPWVPFYLIVVFLMHWMLGVAAAIAALVIFVLAVMTELSTRAPTQRATVATMKASLLTDEVRRNSESMHALGMRGKLRARWAKLQQSALDDQTRANDAGGTLGAMSRVVRLAVQSGMLALGAYLAIKQEISPGTIIASSIIMSRSLAPVEQAVANWQQFLAFRKARERLGEVLTAVPAAKERMELPPPRGIVDVDQVTVMLPTSDKPLLQGVSFQVQPGQGLGIIGPTGAGKSTLARLLVGLSFPTRGSVRLDGATFDQRNEDETGRYVGYLPQDVQLFDGTVAENISRFDAKPDASKVVEAAQMASIHDFIMRLPNGYDTPLGENAARLSAGQRQRVALARALYNDPVLLVLDEPNSNLDAEGEAALVNGMRHALDRGAACIVIAHRPSALAVITDLVVLNEGKVAAQGPRDEVLRKVLQKQQGPQIGIGGAQPQPGQSQASQPQQVQPRPEYAQQLHPESGAGQDRSRPENSGTVRQIGGQTFGMGANIVSPRGGKKS